MVIVMASGTPPANSSQISGATNVPVEQLVLTNPSGSAVNVTSLILSVSGTGNPADITSVTLSANGATIATASFSGTTAVFSLNGNLTASSSVTYTVTANFGTNASGTYTFGVTAGSGTSAQGVQFSGLPVGGATITVSHATTTPTLSPTSTLSPTPKPHSTPVIYPNPSNGGPVNILPAAYTGNKNVKIQIFTTAFRKVQEKMYDLQPYGPITITMEDNWGNPLASGLYYVVIEVDDSHTVSKLLLLR
jgi:hypothetical protein